MKATELIDPKATKAIDLERSKASPLIETIWREQGFDQALIDTLQSILSNKALIHNDLFPSTVQPLTNLDRLRVWALRAEIWVNQPDYDEMMVDWDNDLHEWIWGILHETSVDDRQRLARWVDDPPVTGPWDMGDLR